MLSSQPQRVQELFKDKITEFKRLNLLNKAKDGVKYELFKFHKNIATFPENRKPDKNEQLKALVNLCQKLNESDNQIIVVENSKSLTITPKR